MLRTQTSVDKHLFGGGECARALRLLCAMAELGFILGVPGPSLVRFPTLSLLMDVHCSVPKKDDQWRKINKVMSSFDKMGFNAT